MTEVARKKVLWVEDDPFLYGIIAQKLQQRNWEVTNTAKGEEVLQLVRTLRPNVIVLDIILPGMDGMEVLKQLKGDESMRNIPVILFSNVYDAGKVQESKLLGAESFLVKAETELETILAEIEKVGC